MHTKRPYIYIIYHISQHITNPINFTGAIAFEDLGKLIAKNWKALPDDERAKFAAEAAKDKERYQREVEESNAKLPQEKAKAPAGPNIRNKRLGEAVLGGAEKRQKTHYDGQQQQQEGQYPNENQGYPQRGPPPYYDPYYGYGRPGAGPNGEGYGPPPPGMFLCCCFVHVITLHVLTPPLSLGLFKQVTQDLLLQAPTVTTLHHHLITTTAVHRQ